MYLHDFEYNLPDELIARFPLKERTSSRLLCLDRKTGQITHGQFLDIIQRLAPNDLLICNNTKVIPARLMGKKTSGGAIEMLVERILDPQKILAHIRASKSPKPGSRLLFREGIQFEVLGRRQDLFELRCEDSRPVLEVIESIGQIPLPPYMNRLPDASDQARYQTVFAEHKGSVAAPTAGLHFDPYLFQQLHDRGVDIAFITLHVGAGTFSPVRVSNITEHQMHPEYVEVSPAIIEKIKKTRQCGGRVIAVGTTTARSLETAALSGDLKPYADDTRLFIYPGFQFRCIDGLITNFHLPGSTLLMLVAAFGGFPQVMAAYQAAVKERYRFFSYGDAMFVF